MKMMIISTGMPYEHQMRMLLGNFKPLPASASVKKFFQPHPHFDVQNNVKIRPPSGRMLFDTRKSSSD